MNGFICCSFSVGLDELPRRKQRDPKEVLRVLHRAGRFSVFEATDNQTIARMMSRLERDGLIECELLTFPWTACRITDRAHAMILGDDARQGDMP